MLSQMLKKGFIIDGIRWVIGEHPPKAIPLCPKDFIQLVPYSSGYIQIDRELKCRECSKIYPIPRVVIDEGQYVLDKLNSRTYKAMSFTNLDNEEILIAENKIPKNSKYFVTSVLTKSKVGLRLIVYAGESGREEKTQIFVEPEIRRLAFDQKNLHPTDIFTRVEATFSDGTKASIKKKK